MKEQTGPNAKRGKGIELERVRARRDSPIMGSNLGYDILVARDEPSSMSALLHARDNDRPLKMTFTGDT